MSADIQTSRASPVLLRRALEIVQALQGAGVEFVPVPVLNESDRTRLWAMTSNRLDALEAAVLAQEGDQR
jgi:hypothetical protein